jgi:HPr kinase/phosphorylase
MGRRLSVRDLFLRPELSLKLVTDEAGFQRPLTALSPRRPGLLLAGYLKGYLGKRLLIFGPEEMAYLHDLKERALQEKRLSPLMTENLPLIILAGRARPLSLLERLCKAKGIPLMASPLEPDRLLARIASLLAEASLKTKSIHGTLIEAFGIGVLIQGESAIGKSEAALGLIERGHRLVADDMVLLRARDDGTVEGAGSELSRHHLEIRGIGIVNVAHLFGSVCVRDVKRIDLVVQLEAWDESRFYDRVGLQEELCEMLGVKIPFHVLPLKPGRDVVLLIETLVLNHRLKEMGLHSAREFQVKLLNELNHRKKHHGQTAAQSAR